MLFTASCVSFPLSGGSCTFFFLYETFQCYLVSCCFFALPVFISIHVSVFLPSCTVLTSSSLVNNPHSVQRSLPLCLPFPFILSHSLAQLFIFFLSFLPLYIHASLPSRTPPLSCVAASASRRGGAAEGDEVISSEGGAGHDTA